MDTSDLSVEAYDAIMTEAEKFNHGLTLQFGLISYDCKDESDFVNKSVELIYEMMGLDYYEIDDMFFGNPPEKKDFHSALQRILINIRELKKIPIEKRTDFWI